jgi:hypothetical protein
MDLGVCVLKGNTFNSAVASIESPHDDPVRYRICPVQDSQLTLREAHPLWFQSHSNDRTPLFGNGVNRDS